MVSNWGGRRENAGRKPIWNNTETCTIRVPKIYAHQVMQLAHQLDNGFNFESVIKSNQTDEAETSDDEDFSTTKIQSHSTIDNDTKSNLANDFLTESKDVTNEDEKKPIPTITESIEIARKILKQKKSARYTVTRLISKIYDTPVSYSDLK